MFQLSEVEKVLVLGICLSLVALTVVITVCVVFPSCWLYECLRRLAKKRKMKYGGMNGLEEGRFIKMTGTPQYTFECKPPSRMITKSASDPSQNAYNKTHNRKREDSTYSSMSSSSQGNASVSNYSETSADTTIANRKDEQDTGFGQVTFSIWCGANENGTIGQLVIIPREAQFLPPRQYGGTCDPYLKFSLYKDKGRKRWSKNSRSMRYEFCTTTQVKTQHPFFENTFVMEVTKSDLKDNVLKIVAYDHEKYANDSELGEITFPLKDIPFGEDGEEHVITLDFLEPKLNKGEMLFGLSYLPTAERLTINIMQAKNLLSTTNDVESFAPFIRVLILHNGKLLKKKKTSTRPGTINPVFNESLSFDLPPDQLDHVVFLLVASHHEPHESTVSSPDSPTTPPNSSAKKGRHIGKVVVGSFVRGLGNKHWKAMKESPRKQVTQWHTLR